MHSASAISDFFLHCFHSLYKVSLVTFPVSNNCCNRSSDLFLRSEERLQQLFDSGEVVNDTLYNEWKQCKKKSDMADALCMCVDSARV